MILSASKCLVKRLLWWCFSNSSLIEESFETYNDLLYSIISWLFNVQASMSLFHILIVSSVLRSTVNLSSCCKILMSLTMNLLLKSYIISWIVNTLTIAHEMSCLQSTVLATELSCFSAMLQFLWINVSTFVFFEVVDLKLKDFTS